MSKINTILFDLDGTLVDSNELIIESFRVTFAKYQPNINYTREQLIDFIGPPLRETFKIVSTDLEIITEIIQFYRKFYQANEFKYITLYDNVLETLSTLSSLQINLGIVTTKFKESALPSIQYFGLDKYIEHYTFLGDSIMHKPSPDPIYHALSYFDNVEKALMIGDNPSDILAGRNANIMTCGLEWSLVKDKLKTLNPDFWINDYTELIDIIRKDY